MKKTYLLLIIAIFFYSCDDTKISDVDDNDNNLPASNVSYAKHIAPFLTIKCARSGCHDDASRAGGFSVTSWQNTTISYTIVQPFRPDASRLYTITSPVDPKFMHNSPYPTFTTKQREALRVWILEGAKNN